MKFLVFKRESNRFDDIIKDPALKNKYKTKITYANHMILGFPEEDDSTKLLSYIVLKYGDDMLDYDSLVPDRSPVPYKDYVPIRKK